MKIHSNRFTLIILPCLILFMLSLSLPLAAFTEDEGRLCVQENKIILAKGTSKKIEYSFTNVEKAPRVTFASDQPKIASVQSGKIYAHNAGQCTITLSSETPEGKVFAASIHVVVEIPVSRLSVTPARISIDEGASFVISAKLLPADASNTSLLFSSDNESVASVQSDGTVTGIGSGECVITVTTNDRNLKTQKTENVKVTVHKPVTYISLTGPNEVDKGKKVNLSYEITPADAYNKKLVWTSSDPSVATVSASGQVQGKKAGICTITASSSSGIGVSSSHTIQVIQKAEKLSADEKNIIITEGGFFKQHVHIYPEDTTNRALTWSSGNPEIAYADENGVISALSPGTAKIYAKSSDGSDKSITFTVTVEPKVPVEITGARKSYIRPDTIYLDIKNLLTKRVVTGFDISVALYNAFGDRIYAYQDVFSAPEGTFRILPGKTEKTDEFGFDIPGLSACSYFEIRITRVYFEKGEEAEIPYESHPAISFWQ
ncbi:MAG: Ig domain-containing protein [Clostridia bacterium]|nr:Ig domain-containing protein [Clostridia bacterium]MBQ4158114.1 Ig domain-containing protein [Clostridia bacterium]